LDALHRSATGLPLVVLSLAPWAILPLGIGFAARGLLGPTLFGFLAVLVVLLLCGAILGRVFIVPSRAVAVGHGIAVMLEAGHVHPAMVGAAMRMVASKLAEVVGHLAVPPGTARAILRMGPNGRTMLPRAVSVTVEPMLARPLAATPVAMVPVAIRSLEAVTREVARTKAVTRIAVEGMRRATVVV
jgi:hypothetical protein